LSACVVLMSGYAEAHPSDLRSRSGHDLRTRGGVFPNISGYDTEIEWNTARGHLDQFRRRAVANDDLVAGRTLEHGGDFVQGGGDAAPCYDLKFSGLHGTRPNQSKNRSEQDIDRPFAHDAPLFAACCTPVDHAQMGATIRGSCRPCKRHIRV